MQGMPVLLECLPSRQTPSNLPTGDTLQMDGEHLNDANGAIADEVSSARKGGSYQPS
jgi:hypothetical protein